MSSVEAGQQPESERTEDAVYRDLGRYVVVFQALQNELVQLASFALDPTHSGEGRHQVAELRFGRLVKATRRSVHQFLDQHHGEEPEFREHLEGLLQKCLDLAKHRNKVVHSTYLFMETMDDELVAIVRSDMNKGAEPNEVDLDQEQLQEGSFDTAMGEIGEVAFQIGQCRTQLIAWYKPEGDARD
jgi:hypothetical protein